MSEKNNLSRRNFLKSGSLAGAGVLFSFYMPSFAKGILEPVGPNATSLGNSLPAFSPNAFLSISADGTITITCPYAEMGQGIYTAIAQLIGEELDADWQKIKIESAPISEVYNHLVYHCQMTGGSSSVTSEYDRMRQVGATARYMLVGAAALDWGVSTDSCTTSNGTVMHSLSGKTADYGSLAGKASEITAPKDLKLKDQKDQTLIGKNVKRLDTPNKTNGKAIYGIDISLPNMLVAVVSRCPGALGKVKSFDDSKAKAYPGVKAVINTGNGVAVVATGYWAAHKGRELLEIIWNRGEYENFSSKAEMQQYKKDVQKPGMLAMKKGDIAKKAIGGKSFDVEYEFPYLTSATMEPLNCVADVKADSCDIYVGTQGQTFDLYGCAGALKMKPEQIKIHTQLSGGGFGRRCQMDAHMVVEAAILSKIMQTPIKVIWSREDDMRSGYYRFANYHKLQITTDAKGNPHSWMHRMAIPSFVFGTPFEGPLVKNGVDYFQLDGGLELVYDVPNTQIEWVKEKQTIPGIWQRANSHFYTAYIKETMIDVMAKVAKKNPYSYRLSLLKDNPKHTLVLKTVAEKSGWGKPLPKGHAQGMAIHENFGSTMASVVELSITDKGKIKVHKIVSALDCGVAVNPANVESQVQGGAIWAISQALYGEINVVNGEVLEGNFNKFKVARMFETPEMELHIVPSKNPIGGIGEASVGCIAPAMANAILALTGKHHTKMPFPADVRKA